jgi:very-short-patch-repair endonuclease
MPYCIDCKKETKGFGRRCHSCVNKRRHYSKKTKEKMRNVKRGKNNPNFGKHRSDETKERMRGLMKGEKNPMFGKHHSKKSKEKIRKKMSIIALKRVQTQHGPYKDTKPERVMQSILKELNIPFECQFRVGNHIDDFHLLNTNTLIEVDGDYWHGNLKKFSKLTERQLNQKQKDKKHNKIAKEKGYIVLRFWESDILNNKEKVIKKLKSVTKE